MKVKEIIITIILCLFVTVLFAINYITNTAVLHASDIYEIYLNGNVVGFIDNEDDLYQMIDNRQQEIKAKFNVTTVYPPASFKSIKTSSYKDIVTPVEQIYEKLSTNDTFTIQGYIITIKGEEKNTVINVLEKEIWDEALIDFVLSFVDDEEYNNYKNNTQSSIEGVGKIIEAMYFDETLTIKKGYISVNDKIYTTKLDLSQYLLFGEDYKLTSYTVKAGDTIASIAEANQLNPKEFLAVNPKYNSVNSMLTIGDTVNVTLINPVLTFSYEVYEVVDSEVRYDTIIEYDYTKPSNYSEVKIPGVNGISRMSIRYLVKNGARQSGALKSDAQEISKKIDQVIVRGPKFTPITGNYVDTGTVWGWPTNQPSIVTQEYGNWNLGEVHQGIDISGTGTGSPIYAVADGVVYAAGPTACGWQGGECVIIAHSNGYYSMYAHMVSGSLRVGVGQQVSRGTVLGGMGDSGLAFGVHLHFSMYNGIPYAGGSTFNPRLIWQ